MESIGQNSTFFPEQHQHKPTKTFVPGQHARIQEFFVRGRAVQAPQLILQFTEGPNGFITHFPGGGGSNFFQEGVQMLISIETHIHVTVTCDFPGGSGPLSTSGSANVQCAFWHK